MREFCWIDGTTVTCGPIRKGPMGDEIPVYFERDDGEGDFDFAEGSVPSCRIPRSRGYSEYELRRLKDFLKNNQLRMFDEARGIEWC